MLTRELIEERELAILAPGAVPSARSKGREQAEEPDPLRTAFQRDRDRIIHSKAFRRLKHKTQVFLSPEGDHYRTRLTHTMEVAQVARTAARALALNEDLAEACALGHDLGHTPFGHLGEEVFSEVLPEPFIHAVQSLRVVEKLEHDGRGLNLTAEVKDGIVNHSWRQPMPFTLEGRVVRYSDRIAYLCHDVDDAVGAGLIEVDDLPLIVRERLGKGYSERLAALVNDLVRHSDESGDIGLSDGVAEAMGELREFMFSHIYHGPYAIDDQRAARHLLHHLFSHFVEHPDEIHGRYRRLDDPVATQVVDYLSGMTDRYAIRLYEELFLPSQHRR